jgi:hypothetical protein
VLAPLGAMETTDDAAEIYTLTDGRTFTGWYDIDRKRLLIKAPRAEIVVAPEQIERRSWLIPRESSKSPDERQRDRSRAEFAASTAAREARAREVADQAARDADRRATEDRRRKAESEATARAASEALAATRAVQAGIDRAAYWRTKGIEIIPDGRGPAEIDAEGRHIQQRRERDQSDADAARKSAERAKAQREADDLLVQQKTGEIQARAEQIKRADAEKTAAERTHTFLMGAALLAAVLAGLFIYALPSIIAALRNHPHRRPLTLMNLLAPLVLGGPWIGAGAAGASGSLLSGPLAPGSLGAAITAGIIGAVISLTWIGALIWSSWPLPVKLAPSTAAPPMVG